MDFAKRAHDHAYHIDPIVRSLGDVDFYKITMLQPIWKRFRDVQVTFAITNRTADVRLAEIIDLAELDEQLRFVRDLRFEKSFLIWLRGQTFYGRTGMFEAEFIQFLSQLKLPDYKLSANHATGQIDFETTGNWVEVTLWETIIMCIINTMRYRTIMRGMSKSTLDITYARAKVKLYAKLEKLAEIPDLKLTDFGTRRRHDFLWQSYCIDTAREVLGDRFTGTSNVEMAYRKGLEATGTNAHELPMVMAALAQSDENLKDSQYRVLREWREDYYGNMLVFLPDTFGTTQFLANMPTSMVQEWKGARPDSKDPIIGGEELIKFWKDHGINPKDRVIIFADGLDVAIDGFEPNGADITAIHEYFNDQVDARFGWGTMLTNDFIGCVPGDAKLLKPISLVCKVKAANGRGAVKLSDNYTKATGTPEEVERYRRVFGTAGMANAPVVV